MGGDGDRGTQAAESAHDTIIGVNRVQELECSQAVNVRLTHAHSATRAPSIQLGGISTLPLVGSSSPSESMRFLMAGRSVRERISRGFTRRGFFRTSGAGVASAVIAGVGIRPVQASPAQAAPAAPASIGV